MTTTAAPTSLDRFCALWAEGFSRALASLGVSSPAVEATDPVPTQAPTPEEFERLVCIRFSCGGALQGELLWVAEKLAVLPLAQLQKHETPNPAVDFSEAERSAFAELLQQVAAGIAAAWKTEFGADIELAYQTTVEPAPVTAQSVALKLSGEKVAQVSLRLFLNEELSAALSALPAPAAPQKENPENVRFAKAEIRGSGGFSTGAKNDSAARKSGARVGRRTRSHHPFWRAADAVARYFWIDGRRGRRVGTDGERTGGIAGGGKAGGARRGRGGGRKFWIACDGSGQR